MKTEIGFLPQLSPVAPSLLRCKNWRFTYSITAHPGVAVDRLCFTFWQINSAKSIQVLVPLRQKKEKPE